MGQRRVVLVAPGFRVEVQAQDNVGTKVRVHAPGAFANLTRPIKENLALPTNGLFLERIIGSIEVISGIIDPFSLKYFAGRCLEIVRSDNKC